MLCEFFVWKKNYLLKQHKHLKVSVIESRVIEAKAQIQLMNKILTKKNNLLWKKMVNGAEIE